jgi:mycobactin salicyl-AMP ligase
MLGLARMSDVMRRQPLRLQGAWSHLTIDAIAETAARARPGRKAFTDASDRLSWTDGAPRAITSGELGQDLRLFARKIATLGLEKGDRVLILMPNIVEGVSTIVGTMLAGLVPCPVSVVSAPSAIVAAAETVKASAIITVTRYAHLSPAKAACEAASRYYGIRFVAAFGSNPPPGVIPLSGWPDDDVSADTLAAPQPHQTALVTFDTEGGALARTHAQVVSEALALSAISGLTSRGNLLGTFTPVSAAGVIATIAAPLISGAHVHLHGPFSPETLSAQIKDCPDAILILPSAAEAAVRSLFAGENRDTIVINREPGVVRAPEAGGRVTELVALGEWATWALLRDAERRRSRLPRAYAHPVATALPRADILIKAEASPSGMLQVSGPGLATAFGAEGPQAAIETSWTAKGDGPQHLVVTAEGPAVDEDGARQTIAA